LQRGEALSAYQVLVAGTPERVAQDQGDQWDSGKVESEDSIQVAYAGHPLASGRRYYWKVRYWDKEGRVSPYSEPAWLEMGLLSRDEWTGQWVSGGKQLRKEFQLSGAVARARVYVTALGYYELRINGERVGQRVLDPAYTTYPKRVLYTTYDVTPLLKEGPNAIAAMLGGGWATLEIPGGGYKPYYPAPALFLQMNVDLQGGGHFSLASDTSWKAAQGPILSDSLYNGEVYDARSETPGWDRPGFDDSTWKNATVVAGSSGILSAEMMPPIRVVDEMVPKSVSSPEPGAYVFDMGQNLSGWARLRVQGPRGSVVTMRFAELLDPDGMINRANLRTAKARDVYVLRGGGVETYAPHFTYHGFRYVELTGFPGTPSLDALRGEVVRTAVGTVGSFSASKQILNQIQHLIYWSQTTNLFSIPTDCDQRDERQGWLGDAQVTAEEAMMNFDMAAFYTNFVRDIRDAQGADGSLPSTVPRRWGDFPGDLGWETAYPLLCWYMWEQYGDRRILEQNEQGLKQYVAFLRSLASDNVFRGHPGHEGDWVEVEHTPYEFIANVWYYYDVEILGRIERVLGNSPDAASYSRLAEDIRDAFNRTFFDPKTGEYANATQAANAMALFLNLPAKDQRGKVAGNLTNDIVYYHNTHVTTGFIGVKFLMPALTEIGRTDLAYELAAQTTYPSWGFMIAQGATTLWELWEDKTGSAMNSHDHAMFGSVGAWFYRALAGIDQETNSAGYRHIRIEPHPVEDLHWASGTIRTIRGDVSSSWAHSPGVIRLHVVIPVGADATVLIPKEQQMTDITVREGSHVVWEDGHYVAGDPGVTGATGGGTGWEHLTGVTLQLGSGEYSLVLTGR
jgi:alpha-L-rhamnosidase